MEDGEEYKNIASGGGDSEPEPCRQTYLLEMDGVSLHCLDLLFVLLGHVEGLVPGQTQILQLPHLIFQQGLYRREPKDLVKYHTRL